MDPNSQPQPQNVQANPPAPQQTPAGYAPYGPQPATAQQPAAAPTGQMPQPQAAAPQMYQQTAPPPAGSQAAPPPKKPLPNLVRSNPNSTQNALQIAEIRDGIAIMNDGSFRSVLMLKSINFDLMSPQEREGVEYAYQGFLNSLYFPIQIFVRSQKVDIRPYIERMDKIRQEHDNMLLALLMDDYIGYIDALAEQTNIMDKKFYVVIPYFPALDVQKAMTQSKNFFSGLTGLFKNQEKLVTVDEKDLATGKDELRNRVQAALGGLQQCGVQGLPLDTQELIELYYDSYNPDTATRQQLKNFNDLTAPIVSKGQGSAPQPNLERQLL